MTKNQDGTRRPEAMVTKSFTVPKNLWTESLGKARANAQSLSAVIQRLLRMWLDGEIDISSKS